MDRIRAHIFVYGDVIGVGFRYWTVGEARKLSLTGWVKNLSDCVEILIEGNKNDVEKLVKLCHDGPLTSNVSHVQVKYDAVTNEYTNFSLLKSSS